MMEKCLHQYTAKNASWFLKTVLKNVVLPILFIVEPDLAKTILFNIVNNESMNNVGRTTLISTVFINCEQIVRFFACKSYTF